MRSTVAISSAPYNLLTPKPGALFFLLTFALLGCATTGGGREGDDKSAHDRALEEFLELEDRDSPRGKALVETLRSLCEVGLSVACTNFGYLLATGEGVLQNHREALRLFEAQCPHPESWDQEDAQEDLVLSGDYSSAVACSHWEVLARGLLEERVISSFRAEEENLKSCYLQARSQAGEEEMLGRIRLRAQVSGNGGGGSLEVIESRVGEGLEECVLRAARRHLDDGVVHGPFQVEWSLSFLTMPEPIEEPQGGGCESSEVQEVVGQGMGEIQECAEFHRSKAPEDVGVIGLRWVFRRTGEVARIEMNSTVESQELLRCLQGVIRDLQITPFPGGSCQVAVPIQVSSGEELHFVVLPR